MASEALFLILFVVLLVSVMGMRFYFMAQVRQSGERLMPDQAAIEREGRGVFYARAVLFFLLIAFLVFYLINPTWMVFLAVPLPIWLRWTGFVVGIASLGLWTWAQAALGRQWSAQLQLREEHQLVVAGPYYRIRHPIYTAMLGYGAGLALVTANWVFVVIALAMVAGLVARVPKEERMMIEEFGEQYRIYMRQTGRFLPIGRHSADHSG
jgi:protein-S-isoprenylcysteine O-methyltransferase Ste14